MFEQIGGFGVGPDGMPLAPESIGQSQIADLYKALVAGSGVTDIAALTGGGALRLQSIDHTLMSLTETMQDFRLWTMLDKTPARATIDEWTEVNNIGGYPGGSFNDELGSINEGTSELARRFIQIKYLMAMRSVSFVKQIEGGIADPVSVEQVNGCLQILRDAEWGLFYGDSSVVPQEFDGLQKLITTLAPDNVIDIGGQPLSNDASELVDASRLISDRGNWGVASHGFWSAKVQGDLDKGLDPAVRVGVEHVAPSGGETGIGILRGNPVVGIKSSFSYNGRLAAVYDKFIEESDAPAAAGAGKSNYSLALNTAAVVAPASITGVAANDTTSMYVVAQAGNYYYGVEGINRNGRSAFVKTAAIAVISGDKVTLTITDGASTNVTGYIVYRSRKNGSNATDDFRQIGKVVKAAGATTTFVDFNRSMPGTSSAFILNLSPNGQALDVRRLLPMMKFPLYPTNSVKLTWAQLMFFALRMTKPRQHVMLKNILPRTAVWKPFG